MTDETLSESATFADRLSPVERAKLGLQNELTVFEIGLLTYPGDGDREKRQWLTGFLLEAIKTGKLIADGEPGGWKTTVQFSSEGKAQNKGPFPSAQSHQGTRQTRHMREQRVSDYFGLVRLEKQDWEGDNCLVDWMEYHRFLATPAAYGIPKPNWPTCPKLKDMVPYRDAKADLHATDADMCAWTLNHGFQPNSGLTAYKKFNGRLDLFDWKDAKFEKDDKSNIPWLIQLRSLWFVRAELEQFHPDRDMHYVTYLEAITCIQQALPTWSRTDIENQLLVVAGARMPELNLDLVAIDPLAAQRELSQKTLPECLFLVDQLKEFVQQYSNDSVATPLTDGGATAITNQSDTVEPSEPESDTFLKRPRTRNAHPVGLSDHYSQWRRLDDYPRPDHLELQVRDGSLRVAVKANAWRAYRVLGRPDSSKSDVDYEDGWSRDGTPPKDSPLLRVEGFWYLESEEAFRVLSDFECRVNWLLPTDLAELHRRWPDWFPDQECYLDLEKWREVRREDLFWFDASSPSERKPEESIPLLNRELDKDKQGAEEKGKALVALLDEIDKRAMENDAGFDRHSLPGTKKEFEKLLKDHCPVFRHVGTATIADYLKGKCQFQRGAKSDQRKGAVIWALFPEHNLK